MKIWTDLSSILSGITRWTDRRTDRRTDRILIAKPRLHCMQRGSNGQKSYTAVQYIIYLFITPYSNDYTKHNINTNTKTTKLQRKRTYKWARDDRKWVGEIFRLGYYLARCDPYFSARAGWASQKIYEPNWKCFSEWLTRSILSRSARPQQRWRHSNNGRNHV